MEEIVWYDIVFLMCELKSDAYIIYILFIYIYISCDYNPSIIIYNILSPACLWFSHVTGHFKTHDTVLQGSC